MEKHSGHHSHHHPHSHNHVVDGPTSRRDFLRVLMGGALAGASILELAWHRAAWAQRGSSQLRAQPLRHSEGCQRRLLCACPSSGHVELQRRHIRPLEGCSRGRRALQAIGGRFSDRPDEAGSYHQAGALRDQYPLSLGPHQGDHAYRLTGEKVDFIASAATRQLMASQAVARMKASVRERAATDRRPARPGSARNLCWRKGLLRRPGPAAAGLSG